MDLLNVLRRLRRFVLRRSEGEALLRARFRRHFGRELDIVNPGTFSERIFARMVAVNRTGDATLTRLADKFQVREFVRERVGSECLVTLLWSGTNPDAIPFDALPERCMIKTNHGSGGNIPYRAGMETRPIRTRLREWLAVSFYWQSCEYHYHAIPRRILVEEFLDDGQADGPLDYRFWCFHGVPKLIQVDNFLHDINPFYDPHWNLQDCRYRKGARTVEIPRPLHLDEMLSIAARLSEGFEFVRVDLYDLPDRVVFGELTFTPVAGQAVFEPAQWDLVLGQYWAERPNPKAEKHASRKQFD